MFSSFSRLIKKLVKFTSFWRENRLILRQLTYLKKEFALAILMPLMSALFEGFGVGFLFAFLQALVSNSSELFKTGIGWFDIWVLGSNTSSQEQLYRICALILASTLIRAFFNYFSSISMEAVKYKLSDRLNKSLFEQLQSISLSYFGKTKTGEIINTMTTEVSRLQYAISSLGFALYKGFASLIYIFILLSISWQLTILSGVCFGTMGIAIAKLNARIREESFPVSEANAKYTSVVVELVNSIRTMQSFSTQDFERKKFYTSSNEVVGTSLLALGALSVIRPLVEVAATLVLVGILLISITFFVNTGVLKIATLLTFLLVLFRLLPAMQEIISAFATASSFQGSIQSIERLLRKDDKPYLMSGTQYFPGLKNTLEFIDVDFSYDLDKQVLQKVSFKIEQGENVALVGSSGSGKTTLVDLIPRFYDPTNGEIRIDGRRLQEFDIHELRKKMAIVSQETFIFNTSVFNNIAYGIPGISFEEVEQAAKLANALDFIQDMPEKWETQLGDRGTRLSGGQRQRIAIARALLRDPEILILDEATSALDTISEKLIQDSLEKLSAGRTVISIAHRLSTIMKADKVIVIEAGQIVEQGTYRNLLNKQGHLWKYHQMQHSN